MPFLYTPSTQVPIVCRIAACQLLSTLTTQFSAIDDECDDYSQLLLQRDLHLSLALEWTLQDAILADSSDYGVDLAVSKIFVNYWPSTRRWNHLRCPNARWLTCEIDAREDEPSQIVHIDLLDGALRVDGRPLGGLPHEIRDTPEGQEIFHSVRGCSVSDDQQS